MSRDPRGSVSYLRERPVRRSRPALPASAPESAAARDGLVWGLYRWHSAQRAFRQPAGEPDAALAAVAGRAVADSVQPDPPARASAAGAATAGRSNVPYLHGHGKELSQCTWEGVQAMWSESYAFYSERSHSNWPTPRNRPKPAPVPLCHP
eukprot:gene16427-biopygen13582